MKRPQTIAAPMGKVFEAADGLSLFNPSGVEKTTNGTHQSPRPVEPHRFSAFSGPFVIFSDAEPISFIGLDPESYDP